jgi:chemotaxis protein MotA
MSLSSLLGFVFGLGLLVVSVLMSTDNVTAFFEVHAFFMVIGGTVASTYMSYQARYVNIAFKAILWMFKKPKSTREGLNVEIMRLIKWGYVVQQKGLAGLENELKSAPRNDPVINFCLTLVTTAYPVTELKEMMHTAIEAEYERKIVPVNILKSMAGNGPAFGMVGTLVGMIVMLQNFSSDMSKIGQGMALALVATLYGIVMARLICLPAASMLQQKEEIERFRNYMMAEGLVMLAEKKGPRYMQDRLNSYLDPDIHFSIDKQIRK